VLTVDDLADNYLAHLKAKGKLSWKADERYLKRLKAHVALDPATGRRAALGERPAASITKRELTDLLAAGAKKSKTSANRMQSTLRTMWGWASDRDDVPANLLAGVKKIGGKEKSKDRVLTQDELRAFLAVLAEAATRATPIVRLAAPGYPVDRSAAQRSGRNDALRTQRPRWSEAALDHPPPPHQEQESRAYRPAVTRGPGSHQIGLGSQRGRVAGQE
jgi:hypothetical protein